MTGLRTIPRTKDVGRYALSQGDPAARPQFRLVVLDLLPGKAEPRDKFAAAASGRCTRVGYGGCHGLDHVRRLP
jgi:hypothetical protein